MGKIKSFLLLIILLSLNTVLFPASIARNKAGSNNNMVVSPNIPTAISVTVQTVSGEFPYMKYTTDNWTNLVVSSPTSGTYPTYIFTIPGQAAGKYVEYGFIVKSGEITSNLNTPISAASYSTTGEVQWDFNSGQNYGYSVANNRTVEFKYKSATATGVNIAGTITKDSGSNGVYTAHYDVAAPWEQLPMTKSGDIWTVSLTLNHTGTPVYEYKIIVNSTWGSDPRNKDDTVGSYANNKFSFTAAVNNAPQVSVTNPNTGGQFSGDLTIQWTASDTDGDSLKHSVEYTSNNGSTWNSISAATNLTVTSYQWDTTTVSSGTYKVRVKTTDGITETIDECDNSFTIYNGNQSPSVTVTGPNGGETLSGTQNITWSATDPESTPLTITIEYKRESDSLWTMIVNNTSNAGSYSWNTLSVSNYSDYRVKVTASDGTNSANDTSNNVFSVSNGGSNQAPTVTITAPTGAAVLSGASSIIYSATDPNSDTITIDIYITSNDGGTWEIVKTGLSNSGNYSFNTAAYPDGTNYKIKVSATDNGSPALSNFSVTSAFSISNGAIDSLLRLIIEENSQNTYSVPINSGTNSEFTVRVEAVNISDLYGGNINLEYDSQAIEAVPGQAVEGNFLGTGGTTAFIPYIDSSNNIYNFAISKLGQVSGVTGSGVIAKLKFKALSNGTRFIKLSGERIKKRNGDNSLSDITHSVSSATIVAGAGGVNNTPSVTVNAPNGGEKLSGNTNISWTQSDNDPGDVLYASLYYSNNSGSTWVLLVSSLTGTSGPNSYSWDTTKVSDGTEYLVKIIVSDLKSSANKTSNSKFTIKNQALTGPPSVTVISPNGGEIYNVPITIRYSAADPDNDTLLISLYYQRGNSGWNLISQNQPNTGSFNWDIASLPTSSYYTLKVEANDGQSTANDTSNNYFTITHDTGVNSSNVLILSPSGRDNIAGNTTVSYSFYGLQNSTINVSLYVSTDILSGQWSAIVENVQKTIPTTGTNEFYYNWDTGKLSDGEYYIKIEAKDLSNNSTSQYLLDNKVIINNQVPVIFDEKLNPNPLSAKAVRTDFGSAGVGTPIRINFKKPMNKAKVEASFDLICTDDNSYITKGNYYWETSASYSSGTVLTYYLPAGISLKENSNYKVVLKIGTNGAQDIYGILLSPNNETLKTYEWTFKTAMSTSVVNTVADSVNLAKTVMNPGCVKKPSTVEVKKYSGTLPQPGEGRKIIPGAIYEYLVFQDLDNDGIINSTETLTSDFEAPVNITFSYNDKNNDGILDNDNIDEKTLEIYTYSGSSWLKIAGSVVDTVNNTVSVSVSHFSVYAPIGLKASPKYEDLQVFPNPFTPPVQKLIINWIPEDVKNIYIYDVSGDLIKTLVAPVNFRTEWDGKDDSGTELGSGVYFYVIKGAKTKTGKIGLKRR